MVNVEIFGIEDEGGSVMKVYMGGMWVAKTVRVYMNGQWVVKPLRAYVGGSFT